MAELILIGQPFKKRIFRSNRRGENKWFARYQCECGKEFETSLFNVKSGKTKSCGCQSSRFNIGKLNKSHGMSGTRIYEIWCGMRKRCNDLSFLKYSDYGGRGISICERWNDFQLFLNDMGDPPSDKHTLDRIDNNGNYEPSNCRWATRTQQARNMRSNRMITANGITMTRVEWAEKLGIRADLLSLRLSRGWSDQEAIDGKRNVK